jgi:hypothetical protein
VEEEEMSRSAKEAEGAGISNVDGAWAAAPHVGSMCVDNGIEKATGWMGARRAGRRTRRRRG